jgi:hypothetical protein
VTLKDEPRGGCPSALNDDILKSILEINQRQTTKEFKSINNVTKIKSTEKLLHHNQLFAATLRK